MQKYSNINKTVGNRTFSRVDKLNKEIGRQISNAILRLKDYNNRAINLSYISISAVKVSPDMKSAKVIVTSLIDDVDVIPTIESIRIQIQTYIKDNTRMKYIPKLYFILDDKIAKSIKISDIVSKVT